MRIIWLQLILAACIASAISLSPIDTWKLEHIPKVYIRRKNALLPCVCAGGVLDCSERSKFSLSPEDRCHGTVSTLNLYDNEFAAVPDGYLEATIVNISHNQLKLFPLQIQLSPQIKQLDLSQNRITNVTNNGLQSLRSLETLLVTGNYLRSLQFLPLPCGLRHLEAQRIHLQNIQGPLTQCTHLETLDLSKNALSVIPEDTFSELTQLQVLNLGINLIESIPRRLFTAQTQLRSLDLHNNRFRSLPKDVFNSLSNLERLNLGQNYLVTLPSGIFSSLSRLYHLNLIRLPLDTFPSEVENLPALEELELSGMGFSNLPEKSFSSLPRLRELHLKFNSISYLPNNIFSGLSNLKTVTLGGNPITTLPSNMFSDASNLKLVWLPCVELNVGNLHHVRNVSYLVYASCGKFQLQSGVLSVLTKAEVLLIVRNTITTVEESAFIGLQQLKTLQLDRDDITKLPVGVFSHLSQLQRLYLTRNRLTTISQKLFSGLNNLKVIALSHNRLTELPENLFQGLQSLESVDFSLNLLTSVPPKLFAGLPSLKEVNFEGTLLSALPAFSPIWASIPVLSFGHNDNLTLDAASLRPWLARGTRYLSLESVRGSGWPPATLGWLLGEPGVTQSAGSPRGCHCGMVRKGGVLLHLCLAIRCDRRPSGPDDWLAAALRDAASTRSTRGETFTRRPGADKRTAKGEIEETTPVPTLQADETGAISSLSPFEILSTPTTPITPTSLSETTAETSSIRSSTERPHDHPSAGKSESTEGRSTLERRHVNASTRNPTSTSNGQCTPPETNTCKTRTCRKLATNILSMMEFDANPCRQFYEYACGGLRKNKYLLEPDYANEAWQRISDMVDAITSTIPESSYRKFKTLVESCRNYDPIKDIHKWKEAVKKEMADLGKIAVEETDFSENFTRLFLGLLQRDRPFIFEVTLDVNDSSPSRFAVKIFPAQMTENQLYPNDNGMLQCQEKAAKKYKNLNTIYVETLKCMNKDIGRTNAMETAKEALLALGIFSTPEEEDKLNKTLDGYSEFLDINTKALDDRAARRLELQSRDPDMKKITYLDTIFQNLNISWAAILKNLLGRELKEDESIQLYSTRYFQEINEKYMDSRRQLHNALLVAFAAARYHDLVTEQRWRPHVYPTHCIRLAAHLLPDVASALYLNSFTEELRSQLEQQAANFVFDIANTFLKELDRSSFLQDETYTKLKESLEYKMITIESRNASDMPEIMDSKKLDTFLTTYKINETEFIQNAVLLMARNRDRLYKRIDENPINHIWTHFVAPYDTAGISLYSLNVIAIPLGAIQTPFFHPEYLPHIRMAGYGFTVAHEMAHHIDKIGLRFNVSADISNIDEYVFELPSFSVWRRDVNIEYTNLTGTNRHQDVPFEFSDYELSLKNNDFFADTVAIQLAYKTYKRTQKKSTNRTLPYLPLTNDQSFFVFLAQKYCTKLDYFAMSLDFFESSEFPPETRVKNMMEGNAAFYNAFKCDGTKKTDRTFPYCVSGCTEELEY